MNHSHTAHANESNQSWYEAMKAGAAAIAGAGAGLGAFAAIGEMGLCAAGTAVAIGAAPLVAAGAVVGLAGYGIYRVAGG